MSPFGPVAVPLGHRSPCGGGVLHAVSLRSAHELEPLPSPSPRGNITATSLRSTHSSACVGLQCPHPCSIHSMPPASLSVLVLDRCIVCDPPVLQFDSSWDFDLWPKHPSPIMVFTPLCSQCSVIDLRRRPCTIVQLINSKPAEGTRRTQIRIKMMINLVYFHHQDSNVFHRMSLPFVFHCS